MAVCVVALLILLVLGAGPAAASHVSCGDTITADTTLDSDLDCAGDGLRIGADDVTLDLGGHRIDAGGTGVDNGAGHDGVVVEDGVIRASLGVSLVGASGNLLRGLTVDEGNVGVSLDDSDDNTLVHNDVRLYEFFGIVLGGSSRNRIERNSVSTPFPAITGIGLGGSSNHNALVRNSVVGSGVGVEISHSNGNRLARNSVSDSRSDGIFVTRRSRGTLVERNVANRNGDDGIDVEARATTLTGNTANHNGDLGIEAIAGVTDGGGNKAASNGNPAQCTGVACS